jgi:hypothetical protein
MSTVKANTIEPASGGTVTITGAALTTPALGTPASGNLANCTGLPASAVVNTPAGGISATTVQAALNELDTEKFDKAGGTVSGAVTFNGSTQFNESAIANNGKRVYWYEPGTSTWVSIYSPAVNSLRVANAGGTLAEFTPSSVSAPQFQATGGAPAFSTSNQVTGGALGQFQNSGGTFYFGIDNSSGGLSGAYTINYFYTGNYDHVWSINSAEKMRLTASGNLLVGATTGSYHKLVKSSSNDYALDVNNTSATVPYGQRILLSGVTGGTGGYFLSCRDDTERFRVLGTGNVENINNSYGALSDAKLKRDVTDTGPKLPKVLAMRIVNYYLKADQSNTKLLGMIAQELREISPGLVEETPDFEDVVVEPARTDHIPRQRQKTEARTVTQWQVEVRDGVAVRTSAEVTEQVPLFVDLPLVGEDGQPIMEGGQQVVHRQPVMEDYTETVDVPAKIERRATGTVTLSVKYSILVPMLVKAMQELHADFDTRLKALEARA